MAARHIDQIVRDMLGNQAVEIAKLIAEVERLQDLLAAKDAASKKDEGQG